MSVAGWIGLGAGLMQALACALYAGEILRGAVRANLGYWTLGAAGALAVCLTEARAGAPVSVIVAPAVAFLGSGVIILLAVAADRHVASGPGDLVAATLIVVLVWAGVDALASAAGGLPASVALSGAGPAAALWLMLRSTYSAPENERPLPWLMTSAACALLGLAIMAEGLDWPFLFIPALAFAPTLMIGILASSSQENAAAAGGAR